MRRSVALRFAIFIVATLAAVVYLVPTFAPNVPSWWSSFLPTDRIHLGLDLQGGSHLILEVKVDKAIENNVERVKTDLINLLRERGISGVSVERVQATQVHVKAPSAGAERVQGVLKTDFPNLEVVNSQTSGGNTDIFPPLSKDEVRSLRDSAVDQPLETIRNRIDQFGVSEPVIQREGQQQILIQLPGIQDPQRAKEIIGKTALLEFKLVDDSVNPEDAVKSGPPAGREILYGRGGGKGENDT